jgi:hypothetical protein
MADSTEITMVAPMPDSARRAILGENVARAYNLS